MWLSTKPTYTTTCSLTLVERDLKTISVRTSGNSSPYLVFLSVTISGEKLPPFIIPSRENQMEGYPKNRLEKQNFRTPLFMQLREFFDSWKNVSYLHWKSAEAIQQSEIKFLFVNGWLFGAYDVKLHQRDTRLQYQSWFCPP